MCVKKVQAWDHAGKLFTTEEDALTAALKDIADLLMKDHSAKLPDGLLAVSPKLRSVLDRLAAIGKLKPVAREPAAQLGRADVCTPVHHAHLRCRLLLAKRTHAVPHTVPTAT